MSDSLLNILRSAVSADTLRSLGSAAGATESQTRAAVDAALPALLAGVARRAGDPRGLEQVFGQLTSDNGPTHSAEGYAAKLSGAGLDGILGQGQGILKMLFGEKLPALVEALGPMSGLASGDAGKVLAMLAPLAMGALGRFVQGRGLNSASLANLLKSQKDAIAAATPSALRAAAGDAPTAFDPAAEPLRVPNNLGILVPALALGLAAVGAVWWYANSNTRLPTARANAPVAANPDRASGYVPGAATNVKLPNGADLELPNGAVGELGHQLHGMLTAGKTNAPVALAGLKLAEGGKALTADSQPTVALLAKLLTGFADLKLKLGGAAQETLGAAKDALVKAGVNADRLALEAKPDGKAIELSIAK